MGETGSNEAQRGVLSLEKVRNVAQSVVPSLGETGLNLSGAPPFLRLKVVISPLFRQFLLFRCVPLSPDSPVKQGVILHPEVRTILRSE